MKPEVDAYLNASVKLMPFWGELASLVRLLYAIALSKR